MAPDQALSELVAETAGLDNGQLEQFRRLFDFIHGGLDEYERSSFGLELLDAARKDAADLNQVVACWTLTVAARSHPDFAVQRKEYDNLKLSGDLFEGTELAAGSALAGAS